MKFVMFLFPAVSFLNIYIRSEGCDDPGKTFVTYACGRAYIMVNGKDHSVHGRGHNVVIVDAATGVVGHVQYKVVTILIYKITEPLVRARSLVDGCV